MTDVNNSAGGTGAAPVVAKKKRSWLKIIFRTFIVLFLLFAVAVGILIYKADDLVKMGVMRGGKYATEQDTILENARLSFMGGTLNLSAMDIKNLANYKESSLLKMQNCDVKVNSGSLFTHTVVIDSIEIKGLEVTLEQNGFKNNLNDLMEVLKKKTPAASTNSAAQPAGSATPADAPGKELKINKLTMTGTKVHIRGIATLDFDLGPIVLDDPTNPNGRPMKIADLMTKILIHVSQQILENPRLPGDIRNQMKNVTAVVDTMKKDLEKDLKGFKGLTDLKNLSELGKALPDAGKSIQDAGKGLQGLLGGNKTPQTAPR